MAAVAICVFLSLINGCISLNSLNSVRKVSVDAHSETAEEVEKAPKSAAGSLDRMTMEISAAGLPATTPGEEYELVRSSLLESKEAKNDESKEETATDDADENSWGRRRRRRKNKPAPTPAPRPVPPKVLTSRSLPWLTARMSAIAYGKKDAQTDKYKDQLEASGWALEKTFLVTTKAKFFGLLGSEEDAADMWKKGSHCVLAFRGSDSNEDKLNDVRVSKCGSNGDGNCKILADAGFDSVSAGMADEYVPLLGKIKSDGGVETCGKLDVTGHSLGGALATLFAASANSKQPARWSLLEEQQNVKKEQAASVGEHEQREQETHSAGWGSRRREKTSSSKEECVIPGCKRVHKIYTFGAIPVSETPLPNDQATNGCFSGMRYYDLSDEDGAIDFAPFVGTGKHGVVAKLSAGLLKMGKLKHPKLQAQGLTDKGEVKEEMTCEEAAQTPAESGLRFRPTVPMHSGEIYADRMPQ